MRVKTKNRSHDLDDPTLDLRTHTGSRNTHVESGINLLHPESGNHLVGTNKAPGVLTDGSWMWSTPMWRKNIIPNI